MAQTFFGNYDLITHFTAFSAHNLIRRDEWWASSYFKTFLLYRGGLQLSMCFFLFTVRYFHTFQTMPSGSWFSTFRNWFTSLEFRIYVASVILFYFCHWYCFLSFYSNVWDPNNNRHRTKKNDLKQTENKLFDSCKFRQIMCTLIERSRESFGVKKILFKYSK